MIQIYALLDPSAGGVRYIGQSLDAQARLYKHIQRAKLGETSYLCCWLRKVGRPSLQVIEEVETREQADERERFWIAHYRAQGANLTNTTNGGAVGFSHAALSNKKNSEAHRGRPWSEARRRAYDMTHMKETPCR